jgi:hypothetical protein
VLLAVDNVTLSPDQLIFQWIPMALFLISRISAVKKLFHSEHTKTRSHKGVPFLAPLPLLILILTGASRMIKDGVEPLFLFTPTIMLCLAAMYVCYQYRTKRAHPNGKLNLETNSSSGFIVASVLIGATISLITHAQDISLIISLIPFLIGALASTTAAVSFACCADVWYAIGTGQFQMISVDTAGIGFYFVLPIVVLTVRFFDKYDYLVSQILERVSIVLATGFENMFQDLASVEDDILPVYTSFIAFILITNGVGLSLVQSLCPLGGHIFGRVYTHGQPNTKLVAISVDFKDLFAESVLEEEREIIFKMLSNWKVSIKSKTITDTKVVKEGAPIKAEININVTSSDLKQFPEIIKNLSKNHYITIMMDDNQKYNSITEAFGLCKKLLGSNGASPKWYHTGTTSRGSSPRGHSTSSSLGMRSAMWSSYVCTNQNKDINDEVISLQSDVDIHRGGSFIYLRSGSADGSFMKTMKLVLEMLESKEFVPADISVVAKEQIKMNLS